VRPVAFYLLAFHIFSFCKRVKGVTDKDPRRFHFVSAQVKEIAFNGLATGKHYGQKMPRITKCIRLA
jgi:hypothetical protein